MPFIDRSPYRSPARRRVFIAIGAIGAIGAIVAVALAALVVYALVTVPAVHLEEAM